MRWEIFVIGKPKLPFARLGVEEYAGRLRPFASCQVHHLKAGRREDECAALLARSEGFTRVALDERGRAMTSRDLAAQISAWELHGQRGVALIVGGAEGLTEALRQQCDGLWSLSSLTLQHELALVILLEQLYRAYTIKAGLPYHRD